MELQKINVKFFTGEPNDPPLTEFIDLFHGWIQTTDGVYHDVADYSHMRSGPGIVLVANNANLSIDETENRRGLLFSQKSDLDGTNREKLRTVLRSALEICRRLEREPPLRGQVKFSGDEALISINDRLLAPNTEETFEKIKPDVEFVATILFGEVPIHLERDGDRRKRFNIRVTASRSSSVDELLRNLESHNAGGR